MGWWCIHIMTRNGSQVHDRKAQAERLCLESGGTFSISHAWRANRVVATGFPLAPYNKCSIVHLMISLYPSHITRWLRGIPFCTKYLAAGFPSPADDYPSPDLNLHQLIVLHPGSTFFMRAEGTDIRCEGVEPGDLLVVDRSLKPLPGRVVVAIIEGTLRLHRCGRTPLEGLDEILVWGVVTHFIHAFPGAVWPGLERN